MEEITNLTQDDVLGLITDFPVQPRHSKVIITINTEDVDGELVLESNSFSEVQYVMASGPHCLDLKPGQKVILDIEKMLVYEQSETNSYEKISRIKIKPVEVDGKMYALVNDTVIDSIDNR